MKKKTKIFTVSIALALAVGALAALLSGGGMKAFEYMRKPPLSPPGWLFPVVWTVLYIMMGIAAARVYLSSAQHVKKDGALNLYAVQLGLNFAWPLLFFGMEKYGLAFFCLLALLTAVFLTRKRFGMIDKTAGKLLAPYLIWCVFAAYLNLGVWVLN